MLEHDPLVGAYEHLDKVPRAPDALHMLRKIASLVKPIMRKRGWKVGVLTEFYPTQQNLLGLNVNRGQKICLRLRYHNDQTLFLPIEQVVDTMLHELSHNVHGPHNDQFHALWEELRDEHEDLVRRGYTGDGFLSEGRRLGGRYLPIHEMRRQGRAAAELSRSSGRKLGGNFMPNGADIRSIIADAATRRIRQTHGITQGCASELQNAPSIAEQASRNGFRTKADEDAANDRAIAQALWELVQEEEARNMGFEDGSWRTGGLTWNAATGLHPTTPQPFERGEQLAHPAPVWQMDRGQGTAAEATATKESSLAYSEQDSIQHNTTPDRVKALSVGSAPASSRKRPLSVDYEVSEPAVPKPASRPSWACPTCTLVNPINFLSCDACGAERPLEYNDRSPIQFFRATKGPPLTSRSASSVSDTSLLRPTCKSHNLLPVGENSIRKAKAPQKLGWVCLGCGTFMEHQWWTCSLCGKLKTSS